MIDDVTVNLTIENVNIGYNNSGWDLAGIYLGGNAKLNLTIKGENTLAGADMGAGIEVGEKATLVISRDSTGTLTATGGGYGAAGIGGRGAFISSAGGGTKMKPIKLVPLRFWAVRSRQKADDTRYTLIVLAEQELEQEYTAAEAKFVSLEEI